ncbi:hypothetical protein JXC34_04525 [Candidatus Woesearchaeota archaeon]|nr:hypothetical protein [Candidatus Woesearchaeota archaeon]
MKLVPIPEVTDISAINIAIDTVKNSKQALVFCNTRRSAESTAEKTAHQIKTENKELEELSDKILKVLSSPTKQCRRLALCIKKGTAFHHAGLAAKQRELVEDNFRKGLIKIICSTPTLSFGVNLPAFRAIIDLKRYGGRWGLDWIPALEYHQMAGRAGRPDFNDEFGEAICIAGNQNDVDEILERFINAPPENIYSKLAVEPVLRTYCLSLIATGFTKSRQDLISFFEKTFYGKQYGDMVEIENKIDKILNYLEEWGFTKSGVKDDFVSANQYTNSEADEKIETTPLGERVSQLYLDPFTAHQIITSLRRATQKMTTELSFSQMASSTLELRPLSSVRVREVEKIEAELTELSSELIVFEPSIFEPEYDEFLKSIKLSLAFRDWMDEKNEDYIMEEYNIAPGEFHLKRDLADWILYGSEELAKILNFNELVAKIRKTRFRLDKGIKEELVPLARLKNVGRVRARKLFRNGIKDLGDVKKADISTLSQLIGRSLALDLKKQVGKEVKEVPKGKRKGQTSIEKY